MLYRFHHENICSHVEIVQLFMSDLVLRVSSLSEHLTGRGAVPVARLETT